MTKVHNETTKSLKAENEGLRNLLLSYIPEDNYYKKITSWLISTKPIPTSEDIRKISDQTCKKYNFNFTGGIISGGKNSRNVKDGLGKSFKTQKLPNYEPGTMAKQRHKTPLRDITNIKGSTNPQKSDSFLTSNISYGNTPEKNINVPNFPQPKDGIAKREGQKTPTTV